MVLAGLSVISDVFIRPVGVVASESGRRRVGRVAGEPALIGIRADTRRQAPADDQRRPVLRGVAGG